MKRPGPSRAASPASARRDGTRAARTGAAAELAGFYQLGAIGTATGRGFALVASAGQTMLLTSGTSAPDLCPGAA